MERHSVVIKWYRKNQYGVERDFVHPASDGDAQIIRQLTGQKTINGCVRELIRDLSRGLVVWEEVVAP